MKIAFTTLGCKVNQFETQALELCAREHGHEICAFSEHADAYVINTCSVTAAVSYTHLDVYKRQLQNTLRVHRPYR